jgi:hypothetical protein
MNPNRVTPPSRHARIRSTGQRLCAFIVKRMGRSPIDQPVGRVLTGNGITAYGDDRESGGEHSIL